MQAAAGAIQVLCFYTFTFNKHLPVHLSTCIVLYRCCWSPVRIQTRVIPMTTRRCCWPVRLVRTTSLNCSSTQTPASSYIIQLDEALPCTRYLLLLLFVVVVCCFGNYQKDETKKTSKHRRHTFEIYWLRLYTLHS